MVDVDTAKIKEQNQINIFIKLIKKFYIIF